MEELICQLKVDGGLIHQKEKCITCPECGGSGKDNATLDWKCWRCKGLGTIRDEDDDD